jgi:hypothetical protein
VLLFPTGLFGRFLFSPFLACLACLLLSFASLSAASFRSLFFFLVRLSVCYSLQCHSDAFPFPPRSVRLEDKEGMLLASQFTRGAC